MRSRWLIAALLSNLFALAPARADDAPHRPGLPFIVDAFADFDSSTSPAPDGVAADVALAPWLADLAPDVEFLMNDDPERVGREAVAGYFAPLLPVMGTVRHELLSITPVHGAGDTWLVQGVLHITRRADGRAITPIPFTDVLLLHAQRIEQYAISLDPTPLAELFAP
jgi:hypothetical protein